MRVPISRDVRRDPAVDNGMLMKAPNRKRAEQYLAASGAVPLTITSLAGRDVCSITTGSKITGTVAGR
jgi:hypothetical protein